MRLTLAIGCASACLAFGLPAANSAEPVNPAHALAQKFAIDDTMPAPQTPAAKPPAPAPKVAPKPGADYENEMLEAARAEAARENGEIPVAKPAPQTPSAPVAMPATADVQAQVPPQAAPSASPASNPPETCCSSAPPPWSTAPSSPEAPPLMPSDWQLHSAEEFRFSEAQVS